MQKQRIIRHNKKIRAIGVFTSGGDAPGMNAAIRSVVRTGLYMGLQVFGIERGYAGLLDGSFQPFELGSVANIIQRGGTILKSSRCLEFHKKSARKQASEILRRHAIDALVAIGGDGTFRGADLLWREHKVPVAGVPGTIDNDLYGTDVTIGFDTAINTGLRAIDQIRDTASSHDRTFIIEVMGRNSGYIAMDVGIGGGADAVVVPEEPMSVAEIAAQIKRGVKRGKTSSVIVVAEGKKSGNSMNIAKQLKEKYGFHSRVCILGHIQRGGTPSARDRKIASVFGAMAVKELLNGYTCFMTGVDGLRPVMVPLRDTFTKRKAMHTDLILLAKILAT